MPFVLAQREFLLLRSSLLLRRNTWCALKRAYTRVRGMLVAIARVNRRGFVPARGSAARASVGGKEVSDKWQSATRCKFQHFRRIYAARYGAIK